MTSRLAQVALAALLLIVFCSAQSGFAAKASRIELKNGQVYEDVDFSVDNVYKVLTIERGDWKLSFSLPEVGRIIDENSQDITAEYLGEYYQPPDESQEGEWLSETQMERKGYRKRPFDFGLRGGANFSIPSGDYYDGVKSGIGYGFSAIVPVTKSLAIRGTVSKSGMRDDLESVMPSVIVIEDNLSFNAWRYTVSGQYYKWPNWRGGGRMLYYAFAGLGAISHKASGTMTIRDPVSGEIGILYSTGKAENKFILTYGGGIIAMVSKRIGIELGAAVDLVFVGTSSQDYYGRAQSAFVFDLKGGVVALF